MVFDKVTFGVGRGKDVNFAPSLLLGTLDSEIFFRDAGKNFQPRQFSADSIGPSLGIFAMQYGGKRILKVCKVFMGITLGRP